MQYKAQPYHLLIPIFLLVLLLTLLKGAGSTLDVHLYDTMYVIGSRFLLWVFTGFTFLLWAIYKTTGRILLSTFFSWLHIGISSMSIIVIVAMIFWGDLLFGPGTQRYDDYTEFNVFTRFNTEIVIATIVLLAGQSIYIINLLGGLFTKKHSSRGK